MITRPLDLASKLRPEPRNLDWVFLVNCGLLVLFFSLFGSKFVLAPSVGVDFRLPELAGANADAVAATSTITVTASGQIFADSSKTIEGLAQWLATERKGIKDPVLLVVADERVTLELLTKIASLARENGFVVRLAGSEPGEGQGRR